MMAARANGTGPDVVLRVPAWPGSVRVIRSVSRSIAAAASLSVEEIDDLCLAADEAFSVLTSVAMTNGVSLRLELVEEGVDVEVTAITDEGAWQVAQARRSLAWQVLRALAGDVTFEASPEGPRIGFTKRAGRRSSSIQTG